MATMTKRSLLIFALLLLGSFFPAAARAQSSLGNILLPIGGGNAQVFGGFASLAAANAKDNAVNILVLPIALASNPLSQTDGERADSLTASEARRAQIEEACRHSATAEVSCVASLAPIFTHSDAQNPTSLQYFTPNLSAIFILDGDPATAMQVIGGTPVERAISDAYGRGVIISGTGAGGGLLSSALLKGYRPGFSASNALSFGSADVWNHSNLHGFSFGTTQAVFSPHFYERNQLGLLLNAISLPGDPHVGIGLEDGTGVRITNHERLEYVFGTYGVTVLDAETYHAANSVKYVGSDNLLSLRNVLVQMLAPGNFSYNLNVLQHSLAAPASPLQRSYIGLDLPPSAGTLILSGDLSHSLSSAAGQIANPVLARFVKLAGGSAARILVLATGYPDEPSAKQAALRYTSALGNIRSSILAIPADAAAPQPLPVGYTGVLVISDDQSRIKPALLGPVRDAWRIGVPLLADNAAAAALGTFFSAHAPTPTDDEGEKAATQRSFLEGRTKLAPGLSLLNINVEPRLLDDNRWGRLFSLAYEHPDFLSIGLTADSAIEIGPEGPSVLGDNVVFALDLRWALRDLGSNQSYVIANGLLDVFAPGERLQPETADFGVKPTPLATPVIPPPTATPSPLPPPTLTVQPPTPTETPTETLAPGKPTRTPRPTSTPLAIPPVTDPREMNALVIFGILTVLVIVIGILIHRRD